MALRLKGSEVAQALTKSNREEAERLKSKGIVPCLCVVRAGVRADDLAYERGIQKRCEAAGTVFRSVVLDVESTTKEMLDVLRQLNEDESVHGILLMHPLPGQIDDACVRKFLSPQKDVDGITASSMADLYAGDPNAQAPCTAEACMELLDHYGIQLEGKHVVVIGRSLVIGKPVAALALKRNATVTVCHTKTQRLDEICARGDVIVAAVGIPRFVTKNLLSQGQVVLDVGINVEQNGNLVGDVDFETADAIVHSITPVPGGIGMVTSSVLVKHLIKAASLKCKEQQHDL